MKVQFTQEYVEHLGEFYNEALVRQVVDVREAPLTKEAGQTISYSRVQASEVVSTPVIYVPGFTEGIIAKAPFALEMAKLGHDIILPDQNRKKAPKKPDAAMWQAENFLDVIEAEGMEQENVNVIPHSYGALIFEDMAHEAANRGWSCFKDAKIAMLAPAGHYESENSLKLGLRFGKMLKSEGKKTPKIFPDSSGIMLKAGQANFLANPMRAINEIRQMRDRLIDYPRLVSVVGEICIFSYGEDQLFRHEELTEMADAALVLGASYTSPYLPLVHKDGKLFGGRFATHNDEQFNAQRVAGSVDEFFRS